MIDEQKTPQVVEPPRTSCQVSKSVILYRGINQITRTENKGQTSQSDDPSSDPLPVSTIAGHNYLPHCQ